MVLQCKAGFVGVRRESSQRLVLICQRKSLGKGDAYVTSTTWRFRQSIPLPPPMGAGASLEIVITSINL